MAGSSNKVVPYWICASMFFVVALSILAMGYTSSLILLIVFTLFAVLGFVFLYFGFISLKDSEGRFN